MNIDHKKVRLISLFVLIAGSLIFSPMHGLAGGDEQDCVRCLDTCPEDVEEYCSEQETSEGEPCGTEVTRCDPWDCDQKPFQVLCFTEPN